LAGNKDGVLSGILVAPRAFSIIMKYRSGAVLGSYEVILEVLEDYRNKDFKLLRLPRTLWKSSNKPERMLSMLYKKPISTLQMPKNLCTLH
jgi:hypothetical protein